MKKIAIVLALVLLVGGIFAVAALTDLVIDRDVMATVASDIEDNVAVKFEILNGYDVDPELAYLVSDGVRYMPAP